MSQANFVTVDYCRWLYNYGYCPGSGLAQVAKLDPHAYLSPPARRQSRRPWHAVQVAAWTALGRISSEAREPTPAEDVLLPLMCATGSMPWRAVQVAACDGLGKTSDEPQVPTPVEDTMLP